MRSDEPCLQPAATRYANCNSDAQWLRAILWLNVNAHTNSVRHLRYAYADERHTFGHGYAHANGHQRSTPFANRDAHSHIYPHADCHQPADADALGNAHCVPHPNIPGVSFG